MSERDWAQDVRDVMAEVDGARPRTQQTSIGVSDVTGCRRRAAYKVHGVEPTNVTVPHPSALLGTFIHDALLPHLAATWGGQAEVEVLLDGLTGHADVAIVGDGTVVDLKTVGRWAWDNAVRAGHPTAAHRLQVHGYAEALRRAGHPITQVVVIYLNRENGDVTAFEEPVDDDVVADFLARADEIVSSTAPSDVPRDQRGPGLSVICDGCPWLTACWPHEQATLVDEGGSEAVGEMLALYDDAKQREKAAKDDKSFAKAALDGTPAGTYGRFRLTWGKGREVLDQKAVKGLLFDAGITDLPMTTSQPSIGVTPVK